MRIALKLIVLVAILLISLPESRAQDKGLMAAFGAATFQMDDMKYYQEYILGNYPVEGEIISSFPVYYSGSLGYFKKIYPHIKIGAGYTYTTTGAKSDYTDFSGNLHTTMSAVSHRIGGFISYIFMGTDKLDLSLFGRVDANISTMEVGTYLYAGGVSSGVYSKYRAVSPNGSAGLELLYRIGDFGIGIEGGYLLDLPGKLNDTESSSKLYDPEDPRRVLTSDWSGWRAGVKFILSLDR